jgi:spoIIIJ-associated protein
LLGVGAKLAKVRVTPRRGGARKAAESEESEGLPGKIDLTKKHKPQAGGGEKRERKERRERPQRDDDAGYTTAFEKDSRRKSYEAGKELDFMNRLIELGQFELNLASEIIEEENSLYFDLSGEDAKYLIGKDGKTLDALQHLFYAAFSGEEDGKRIVIDVENYKGRKAEKMVSVAMRKAMTVKRTGEPMTMSGVNRFERKAIHEALQKDPEIVTRSEGRDPYRNLIIEKRGE